MFRLKFANLSLNELHFAKATPFLAFHIEFQGKIEAKLSLLLVLTENKTINFFSFTFLTDIGDLPTENQHSFLGFDI